MMKILANRNIRLLFRRILGCIMVFALLSMTFIGFDLEYAALCILLGSLCMSLAVLVFCYRYFRKQNKIMENAAARISEYISGNKNVRIESDDEGELYRLFHEVNSLVSILNAHAENQEKSKMFLKKTISDISHQLKTPLAALNIYNGIIQEEGKELPAIKEFAGLSEQELDRIETLVQNLLKITKLDAGTILLEKSMVNVSDMMEDVKKRFSFRAGQEGKEIKLEGSEDIVFLCDAGWLGEGICNIVKNALDHTEKGDYVSIEWTTFTSVIQIVIKDNGRGIHPEDLHHIFKRFYRSRFSKDTQGIGLGLPLAKAVIEEHNGTIEVDSQLGAGTSFTINFLIPTKM